MILFLNFAPISFMGGAEKWMNETAKKVSQHEPTILISVTGSIASLYSSLVLKRKFDRRASAKDIHDHLSLDLSSFIPFTTSWKKARLLFQTSRLIYTRYELPEFLILLYFSGISGLKKTIAGLHSPFLYQSPITFFDHLHNWVYSSYLSKNILSHVKKVHVLNKRDLQLFTKDFKMTNVEYVPNGMPTQKSTTTIKQDGKLHILCVGELSQRKGTDRLIEVIQDSPKNFIFTIAGDGPLKSEIHQLAKSNENCFYEGFVDPKNLPELYKSNEVLFLPSRAESMPLSILEALSYGLTILDSVETSLEMDKNIEYSTKRDGYIFALNKIFSNKQSKSIVPRQIKKYFEQNFSNKKTETHLFTNVFNLSL